MPLIDLNTAAATLGVSPETLRKWARKGRIASVRLGSRLLFDEQELRRWVARHTRPELDNGAA